MLIRAHVGPYFKKPDIRSGMYLARMGRNHIVSIRVRLGPLYMLRGTRSVLRGTEKGQPFLNTYHQNLMIQLETLPASYKNENDASLAS